MRASFPAAHAVLGALISLSLVAGAAPARPVERADPRPVLDHRSATILG